MRAQGKITKWNDLRGFGFVSPLEGGQRVFLHVSAFPTGSRRPTEGEFISYTLGTDERGRLCATQITYVVSYAKRPGVRTQTRNAELIAGCVAAAFLGVVALLAIVGRLWWPVACVYIVEHRGILRVQARQGGRTGRREANQRVDPYHAGIDRGVAGRSRCATPVQAQDEKGRLPGRVLAQRRAQHRRAGLADCSVVTHNKCGSDEPSQSNYHCLFESCSH